MKSFIEKRILQGFICVHILHYAQKSPVCGSQMMEELSSHGYKISPGTLYPLLHSLEREGLQKKYEEKVAGKIRKYYAVTELGESQLVKAKVYLDELTGEVMQTP